MAPAEAKDVLMVVRSSGKGAREVLGSSVVKVRNVTESSVVDVRKGIWSSAAVEESLDEVTVGSSEVTAKEGNFVVELGVKVATSV